MAFAHPACCVCEPEPGCGTCAECPTTYTLTASYDYTVDDGADTRITMTMATPLNRVASCSYDAPIPGEGEAAYVLGSASMTWLPSGSTTCQVRAVAFVQLALVHCYNTDSELPPALTGLGIVTPAFVVTVNVQIGGPGCAPPQGFNAADIVAWKPAYLADCPAGAYTVAAPADGMIVGIDPITLHASALELA